MLKKFLYGLFLGLCLSTVSVARAEEASDASGQGMTVEQFVASLKFQKGLINLPGGVAALNLPEDFVYLNPADSERVLVQAWGNPPGNESLGMIFPAGMNPVTQEAWGVMITYDEDGHVSDSDADSINYDDLLKDMKEQSAIANEERKKQGYSSFTLVGWAENPTYDKVNHKLYWAQELAPETGTEHGLNYNIRILGRKGVLVLTAISSMSQLAQIKPEMQKILAFTSFTQGNTYADFNSKVDKTAEYGIAALVAGGVAAKLGLFGKLLVVLVALKKVLIVGVLALVTGIKKFFGRKKTEG